MATMAYNLFISFSGEMSLSAAKALRNWIPMVVQAAKPFMSETDVEKGTRGLHEIAKALDGIKFGISCLAPDNLEAPWLHYEAGALSKTIDEKTHLCTYLLGGVQPQDVKSPLGMFQHTRADKEDTRRLVRTINRAINQEPITEAVLDQVFDAMWPKLDADLRSLPQAGQNRASERPLDEMVAEILEISRAGATRRTKAEWMDDYIPLMKEIFPLLEQVVLAAKQANKPGVGSGGPEPAPQAG